METFVAKYNLSILICILFLYSCDNCSDCKITELEKAFIIYSPGDVLYYKNDLSNQIETLYVESDYPIPSYCQGNCIKTTIGWFANFKFSTLKGKLEVNHNRDPVLSFSIDTFSCRFYLKDPYQAFTFNNVSYSDIWLVSTDSTKIPANTQLPWQIAYSKSKGIIRFYLKNNTTITKI